MSLSIALLPAFPLAGFVALFALGWFGLPRRRQAAWVGVGSTGLSAVLALSIAVRFLAEPPESSTVIVSLASWMEVGALSSQVRFLLDPVALVMVLVVTVVGFLIHLYSAEAMLEETRRDYVRFFAYMNLFVASMLILVLSDDLVLLYLGWEGVGLCSFLLIGFWFRDAANGRAARKAFVVTRVGDVALAIAIFLLFDRFHSLSLHQISMRAVAEWEVGSLPAVLVAALLLGGALGKSAQLPLQIWLPDAMAGPTPVSALIHAATMVTAGVYLVARAHHLFLLAPGVLRVVAVLGVVTLLMAGLSALVQTDIKRVLAYSTMSQLGYMFLALGVGAWSAAIFHLMTHAFFKALLFLGAGAVSMALHHERDISKMGGLRKQLPITFVTFVVGGASLAGFPIVTAGFYSKDTLLAAVWESDWGSFWLWAGSLLGTFITALYIFRLVFLVFFGEPRGPVGHVPGYRIKLPIVALAFLSIVGGLVELPATLGDVPLFTRLLDRTLHGAPLEASLASQLRLQAVAGLASLGGILVAYLWFLRRPPVADSRLRVPGLPPALERLWYQGWGFDRLYSMLVVTPFERLAKVSAADFVDRVWEGLARLVVLGHRVARTSQTGRLRWYAAGLAFGVVLILGLVLLS